MSLTRFRQLGVVLSLALLAGFGTARAATRAMFGKVMIVIFENVDYDKTIAQPFFKKFAEQGALATELYAETHPSQPNYIALTSGGTQGVKGDWNVDVDARHIGDLLEAKGLSWKVYAEGYPGNCFLGAKQGRYVRKHVPMLSYKNVQRSPARCARVVEAGQLEKDIAAGTLPEYSLYIPDLDNDGHDTGVEYADHWFGQRFAPLLANPKFMKDMLVIATFDEGSLFKDNQIYTAFVGAGVKAGATSDATIDHYSILRMVEDRFGLGTLGGEDETAAPIEGIWK